MAPLLSSATSIPQGVFKKLNTLANKQWEASGKEVWINETRSSLSLSLFSGLPLHA
jgi:hypothetical protein